MGKERNLVTENGVDAVDRFRVASSFSRITGFMSRLYELCLWLRKFVYEIRTRGGVEYPPNSRLYQMCVGIQRHLRDNGRNI